MPNSQVIHIHKKDHPHTETMLLMLPAAVFVLVLSVLFLVFGPEKPSYPSNLIQTNSDATITR